MAISHNNSYDVIIIGAGISGLVCGSYLSKSGLKVLVVEKNDKPGGYCTSFVRNGFVFDAAAHSLGSFREGGIVKNIITELGIESKLKIKRCNPSDIVVAPDFTLSFFNDLNQTAQQLIEEFPKEKDSISSFLKFLRDTDNNSSILIKMRNKSFSHFLKSFFSDSKLISSISLPILGNGGLPPDLMDAIKGISIFKEFLIDGGYYIDNGIQNLPNALDDFIKCNNGKLIYGNQVKKIISKNKTIIGIELDNNERISSKYVVSACDMRQTYENLLEDSDIPKFIIYKLKKMNPSLSAFLLYIGIDKLINTSFDPGINIWYLPSYDLNYIYRNIARGDIDYAGIFKYRMSPDKKTVIVFVNAPFINASFWNKNKKRLSTDLLNKVEKILPNIKKNIIHFDTATPLTLLRYTSNAQGAAYGWAQTSSQSFDPDFSSKSYLRGLYFTGHWNTQIHGIAGVSYAGYNIAKQIIKKNNKVVK